MGQDEAIHPQPQTSINSSSIKPQTSINSDDEFSGGTSSDGEKGGFEDGFEAGQDETLCHFLAHTPSTLSPQA